MGFAVGNKDINRKRYICMRSFERADAFFLVTTNAFMATLIKVSYPSQMLTSTMKAII
jgi:hypothetical protein